MEDHRRFKAQEEKSSWYVQKSEENENKSCSNEEIDWCIKWK